jgi:hypothetical protein
MNPVVIVNTLFVQAALPIMITFIAAAWLNGKRFEDFKTDINRRLDEMRSDMNSRFDSVERRLEMIQANTHELEIA